MPRTPLLGPLGLLLLATTSLPALAQFTLEEPVGAPLPFVIDMTTTGSASPRSMAFLRIAPQNDADSVLVPVFKRLASDARQLRFDGEMGVNDLAVYIRPDQIAEPARLRLRYLSSVSVMPEASRLLVSVNDQQVAEVALDASAEYGLAEIPVPAGLLQAGYNVVRLSVQQRHRVDCSIEAADELWTQIDPAGTGFALTSSNDQYSSVDDLVGFPEDETGAVPITVSLPPGADIAMMDRALRAVQALAIRADLQKPRIVFSRTGPSGGIHLALGTSSELRMLGVEDLTPGENGIFVSGRGSSLVRVAISGATPSDIDTALLRLAHEGRVGNQRGTPSGLRALAFQRGLEMKPETAIDLAAAGLATQEFSGRLFRTAFNIVLPPDFYPADNGKATLFLDGEYVDGLLTSNEALVRVNGKVVGASRLTRSSGEVIARRPIELSLRALSPGHNRIAVEIRTATESDRDCNPLSLIDSRKRLSLQASTSFAVPRFARAEHLPNLSAMASTGYPFVGGPRQLTVYLPKPDMPALSAAATFLARYAVSAGTPVQASVSLRAPTERSGSALIVGAVGDMSESVLDHFGLRDDMIPRSWTTVRGRGRTNFVAQPLPVADTAGRTAAQLPTRLAALQGKTATDAATAPEATERKAEAEPGWVDRALLATSAFLQRNVGYSSEQLSFLNRGRSSITAPPKSTVVLAQGRALSGDRDSWLLLTGPDTETLQRDTVEFVSPSNWQQLTGRMVAYDPTARELTHFAGGDHFHVAVKERTIGNVTLFAAGWLSNHIQYYVLVLISVCLVFGLFSRKLLNRIGVRP